LMNGMRLLAILSCGHYIEGLGAKPSDADLYRDAKRTQKNVVCHWHHDGGHESYVITVLTWTTGRIWVEEL